MLDCGNPRNSTLVQESTNKFKNHLHIAKSDTVLSPIDLKRLFDCLFSAWNVCELQFWVMVLMFSQLFLRGDQTVDIGYFSIMEDLTAYKGDGTIASFMLKKDGKFEKKQNKSTILLLNSNSTRTLG